MPWKECNPMDERLKFVARLLEGEKMAPLCREFGITRVTGYKIFNRYKECGLVGQLLRSKNAQKINADEYSGGTGIATTYLYCAGNDAYEITPCSQRHPSQVSNHLANLKTCVLQFCLNTLRREVLEPVVNLPSFAGFDD